MTVPDAPATPTVPFGQALGEASRSATAAHLRLLDSEGSSFLEWVVLNLVSAGDGPVSLAGVFQHLTDELSIDQTPVRQVVDSLTAAGRLHVETVDDTERAQLTDAGHTYHQRVRETVGRGTAELLAPFDPAEIATTVRVLVAVKERAPAILPG